MDLGNPWALFSSMIIGLVGAVLFQVGRKRPDLRCLAAGVAMCIDPIFIGSLLLMWVVFAAIVAGLFAAARWA